MQDKRCSKCRQEKPTTEFRPYKQGRYLHSWCNSCRVESNRLRRQKNAIQREPKTYFPPFGEKSHKAKLCNEDVRLIKQLLDALPMTVIGKKFDVSRQTISDIAHGRRWTEVA